MRKALALALVLVGCSKPEPVGVNPVPDPSPVLPQSAPLPVRPVYQPPTPQPYVPPSHPREKEAPEREATRRTRDLSAYIGKWTDLKDGRNTLTIQPGGLASATVTQSGHIGNENEITVIGLSGNYREGGGSLNITLTADEKTFNGDDGEDKFLRDNEVYDEKTGTRIQPREGPRTVVMRASAMLSLDGRTLRLSIPGASRDMTKVQ